VPNWLMGRGGREEAGKEEHQAADEEGVMKGRANKRQRLP
jgi:hypothetical protein